MKNNFANATPLNKDFLDNDDTSVGFKTMLAQNINALNIFTSLPKAQQQALVDGAKQVSTPEEMRVYILNVLQG